MLDQLDCAYADGYPHYGTGPDGHCFAHDEHPHAGMTCLECPICRPLAEPVMTPEELIAYGRGYLDGWARGEHAAMTQPLDPDGWRAAVAEWRRTTEMSLHRLMWDAAVKRGENPTPKEAQNGQARQRPDVEPEGRLPAEARPGREGDPGTEQSARGEAARAGQDQVRRMA